jgi:hypothetical protein
MTSANAAAKWLGLPLARVIDMEAALSQPPRPIPWVCDRLAARGYLTTLVGPPGLGKTLLALFLAAGVHHGRAVGGIECALGHAVYFDAENGEHLIVQRFRAAELAADDITIVDAGRLDLADRKHRDYAADLIGQHDASLAVFDSLKRLTPSARENDNDEMAPVIAGLADVARQTNAAILLLHHKSAKPESAEFRGASAILDQTDMLFGLSGRIERFKLEPRKVRIGPEPAPRWFGIRDDGGVLKLEAAEERTPRVPGKADALRERVVAHADAMRRDGSWPRSQIAAAVDIDVSISTEEKRLDRVLKDLVRNGGWSQPSTGHYAPPPDERTDADVPNGPSCLSARTLAA